MSAFEFLFSFYGLLLGLSIAELAGGFSRVWDRRAIQNVGWLGPLLALVLMSDLISFWTNAWLVRDRVDVGYHVALGAAIVSLLYYFAATQTFPRDGAATSADEHVMTHRKSVIGAVILSNLLVTLGFCLIVEFSWTFLAQNLLLNAPFFVLMGAIGWLPGRRAVLGALVVTLAASLFYEPLTSVLLGLFR